MKAIGGNDPSAPFIVGGSLLFITTMNTIKEKWDWDLCKIRRSKHMVKFFKTLIGKDIGEEEFVKRFRAVPYEGTSKYNARSPHMARRTYNHIKENFDLFEMPRKASKE